MSRDSSERWIALLLAVVGLASLVPIVWVIVVGNPEPQYQRLSGAAYGMRLAEHWMRVLVILCGAGLGLYLAMRGHRRTLARLLALSSASLASGFGLYYGLKAIVILVSPTAVDFTSAFFIGISSVGLLSLLLIVVWLYSTANFLLRFPKPVKVLADDQQQGAARWLARGTPRWAWLASPQLGALAAGLALILLVNRTIEQMYSTAWGDAARYFVCWFPFAVVASRQARLDEESRRAIRWVLLGQAVWLVVFLAAMLALVALRLGNVLHIGGWNDTSVFLGSFFTFFYAGFVIVLLVTLAVSILYHGTLDPDLMIRRTWVLAAVGLTSGVLFVLVERLIANAIADWMGISAVNALTIVAAITAAVIYPMRSWLEARVRWAMEGWQAAHAIVDGRRRDAVIVFADLSGYTALTERNEREALIMAAMFHRDAQQAARDWRGVLVKTIGDAVLLRFDDAQGAVEATHQLEREFRKHAEAMSLQPLPIHAAVHRGEVVESSSGDVFGATVNLAARLLGAAGPGDIVASRAAIESSPLAGRSQSLGERRFKNVELPVECFKVA